MNDSFKKLTAEARAALVEAVSKQTFGNVITSTKAASEENSGTFKVIISTSNTDRQGDSVNQNGWDLSFYKSNPIVLWAHDYASLPIGLCTSIEVVDGKLTAQGKFAPAEANPFAQQVRKLYDLGMINTTSVGFIPKKYDDNNSAIIMEQELLEFSFVPVPANPHALRIDMIKKLGIDRALLSVKGIEITEKGEVADALTAEEMQEQKYEKWEEICEAIDAFCTVYFDDKTPVEDFVKLLNELIIILEEVAKTDGIDEDDMEKAKTAIRQKIEKITKEKTKHLIIRNLKSQKAIDISKAIDEFKSAIIGEHAAHSASHGKAIEDFKEAMKTIDISKSIHLDEMECFKAYSTAHNLENERHSKAIDGHIETLEAALGDYDGEEDKALTENTKKVIRETAHSTIISLLAQGSLKLSDGNDNGRDAEVKPRSRTLEGLDELNKFVEARVLLKNIDNSLEKVLRNFNEAARKYSKGK
jgi:HK97 family phage prohead protease